MIGRKEENLRTRKMLMEANAELKLVIAGNHDLTLDRDYFKGPAMRAFSLKESERSLKSLDAIRELWVGEEARTHGIRFLDEGVHHFVLKNGAKFSVYASPYQPEFYNWAFAYERDEDRYNPGEPVHRFQAPNPIPSFPEIDIVMTHGPPLNILDEVNNSFSDSSNVGCANLLRAIKRCRPLLHCFGHIHEAWGAKVVDWTSKAPVEDAYDPETASTENSSPLQVDISQTGPKPSVFGRDTLFVNASIMNLRYAPHNSPWLVDLDLPQKG